MLGPLKELSSLWLKWSGGVRSVVAEVRGVGKAGLRDAERRGEDSGFALGGWEPPESLRQRSDLD